jgi:O-antigen/teichoic acid export membrane protein
VNNLPSLQDGIGKRRHFGTWFWRQREATRLAFFLKSGSVLLSAVLSLFWAKKFVHALGEGGYGLYLTFVAIAQLGGLGDFGVSGAVGVRMLQFIASDDAGGARSFLATARGLSYSLAAIVFCMFVLLSPWLPMWLQLAPTHNSGSLQMLFMFGGLGAALLILNGLFQSLNYISGNVAWPIVPGFLLTQLAFGGQWALISVGAPLWQQYAVHVACVAFSIAMVIWFLRISHPWLGQVLPVNYSSRIVRELLTGSFWSYLLSIGTFIYFLSDQIVVNAGFGSAAVPSYRFSYKLCELAIMLLASATFVTVPAIFKRVLSGDPQQRDLGLSSLDRLQRIQCFAAVAAALMYLGVNDAFLAVWLGSGFNQSLTIQTAFALNLAITVSGDAIIQSRVRADSRGLRIVGQTVGTCGVLNLVLSLIAMKFSSLAGIAFATVFAQLVQMTVLTRSISAALRLPFPRWLLRVIFVPAGSVLLASAVRGHAQPYTLVGALTYVLTCAAILWAVALALNLNASLMWHECRRLRAECQ